MNKKFQTVKILGVPITVDKSDVILEYIHQTIKNSSQKIFITTPNPEILVYAHQHPNYKAILSEADIALPDGIGLKLATNELKKRITGTDFMLDLCKDSVKSNVSIGLLGGRHGVASMTAECLRDLYPGINISLIAEQPPEDWFALKSKRGKVRDATRNNTENKHSPAFKIPFSHPVPDILFVAFGFPKQEEWIVKNLDELPVRVAMGVGGAFDYISGNVPRAPKFIRNIGFEWLYRLIREPWRWKRQLALPEFIILILKEKFNYSK